MAKCKVCKGEGWVIGYGHACDGDERACEVPCPIQVQEPCGACFGTGRRQTKRAADLPCCCAEIFTAGVVNPDCPRHGAMSANR